MGLDVRDIGRIAIASLAIWQTEQVSAAEVNTPKINPIQITVTETVTASDSFNERLASLRVYLAEQVSAAEVKDPQLDQIELTATESVTISERQYPQINPIWIVGTETVEISDSPFSSIPSETADYETIEVSDSGSVQIASLIVPGTDSSSVSDTSNVLLSEILINNPDTATASDIASVQVDPVYLHKTDTVTISDQSSINALPIVDISAQDALTASDSSGQRLAALQIQASETVSVSDSQLTLGLWVNSGFVTTAPTADPAGTAATGYDGYLFAQRFTTPGFPIIVSEIGWWEDATVHFACAWECAIYANNATPNPDEPGAAVAPGIYTGFTSVKNVAGWNKATVDIILPANTQYWIGLGFAEVQGSIDLDYVATGGDLAGKTADAAGTLDATWTGTFTAETAGRRFAVYAKFTPAPAALNVYSIDTVTASDTSDFRLASLQVQGTDTLTISDSIPTPTIEEESNPPISIITTDTATVSDSATIAIETLTEQDFDSVTISDSAVVQLAELEIQRTETISIADSSNVNLDFLSIHNTETIEVSDASNQYLDPIRIAATDSITASDFSNTRIEYLMVSAVETVEVADSVTTPDLGIITSASDTVEISDTSFVQIESLITETFDTVTAYENASVLIDFLTVQKSEDLSIADSSRVELHPLFITMVETLEVSDGSSSNISKLLIPIEDTAEVSDSFTVVHDLEIISTSLSDTVEVGESSSVQIDSLQPSLFAEQISVSDSASVQLSEIELYKSEDVSISDPFDAQIAELLIQSIETVEVADVSSVTMTLETEPDYENVEISESGIVQITELTTALADSVEISDSPTVYIPLLDANIESAEQIEVSDIGTVQLAELKIEQTEFVDVSDSARLEIGAVNLPAQESVDVYDSSALQFSFLQIHITEIVTTSDIPDPRINPIWISKGESVTVSENAYATPPDYAYHWLFIIGSALYSTQDLFIQPSSNYLGRVIPDSFSGVSVRWNMGSSSLISPNEVSFDLFNGDGAINIADIVGAECMITYTKVPSDGYQEVIRKWRFYVKFALESYGIIHVQCENYLQQFLEGDYPNTWHPKEIWPSLDTDPDELENYCVPVIFGEAYVPVMSVNTGSDRYYVLGTISCTSGEHTEIWLGNQPANYVTGGHYHLGIDGNMVQLNWNDDATTVKTALETVFGVGTITITFSNLLTYHITFATSIGVSALVGDFSAIIGPDGWYGISIVNAATIGPTFDIRRVRSPRQWPTTSWWDEEMDVPEIRKLYLGESTGGHFHLTMAEHGEEWELVLGTPTSGSYILSNGTTSQTIAYNDNAAAIQAHLETIYGAGKVTVTLNGSLFDIAFPTAPAGNVEESYLIANFYGLVGALHPSLTQKRVYCHGGTTGELSYAATSGNAAAIQTALEAICGGVGNVTVTFSGGIAAATEWLTGPGEAREWTAPEGVYSVIAECWGGGGAGSGDNNINSWYGGSGNNGTGAGGGGGAYSKRTFTTGITPGQKIPYYIAGVKPGTTSSGSTGADSWFLASDSTGCKAKGGGGGTYASSDGGSGGAAASGYGDTKYSGGYGNGGALVGHFYNTFTEGGETYYDVTVYTRNGGGAGGAAGTTGAGNSVTSDSSTGASAKSEYGGRGGNGATLPTVSSTGGNGSSGSSYGGGGGGAKASLAGAKGYKGGDGASGAIRVSYGGGAQFYIAFTAYVGETGMTMTDSLTGHTSEPTFTVQQAFVSGFQYAFNQSDDAGYKLAQFIIDDANGDGELDSNGLWLSGDRFLPPLVWYSRNDTTAIENPADVTEFVLEEFGLVEVDLDKAVTFAATETLLDTRQVAFSGGLWEKDSREKVLAWLLAQFDGFIYESDKIELHTFDSTSVETITTSKTLKHSFRPTAKSRNANDGGRVAWREPGEPQDILTGKAVIPVYNDQATITNPAREVLSCGFLTSSISAKKAAILYFAKKFLSEGKDSFSVPITKLTTAKTLIPGQVLTINDTMFGTSHGIIVTDIQFTKNGEVKISGARMSTIEDWDDLSQDVVTVRSAGVGGWQIFTGDGTLNKIGMPTEADLADLNKGDWYTMADGTIKTVL